MSLADVARLVVEYRPVDDRQVIWADEAALWERGCRRGEPMAETSPDRVVVTTIGPLIASVSGAALGWLTGGSGGSIAQPLTSLLAIAGAVGGLCSKVRP